MNRLFRIAGQAIVTITWVVVTFVKDLWEAEAAIFDGGKSDREFLENMRVLEANYDTLDAADRARYREVMRKTV